jgi:hypothetical protein
VTHEANPAAEATGYGGMPTQYPHGVSSRGEITKSCYDTTESDQSIAGPERALRAGNAGKQQLGLPPGAAGSRAQPAAALD